MISNTPPHLNSVGGKNNNFIDTLIPGTTVKVVPGGYCDPKEPMNEVLLLRFCGDATM